MAALPAPKVPSVATAVNNILIILSLDSIPRDRGGRVAPPALHDETFH